MLPISALILLNHIADAVYLIDPESSNILWCNRAGYEELGLSAESVINHSVLSLQKDVSGLPQWSEISAVIRQQAAFTFVGRHRHAEGYEVSVEVNTSHFIVQGQEYFLSVARNISKRVALEQELKERSHQLWFALNEASDGMWDWDITNDSVFFSPQLKRMLGYGPDEMQPIVDTWKNNIHPDDMNHVMSSIRRHLNDETTRFEAEYRLKNRNQVYIWVHDQGKICERDLQNRPTRMVGMVQNISERKLLEERLNQLANTDPLTKLLNRRAGSLLLEQQLSVAKSTKQPICIAFIDLDCFKDINDKHGHSTGDIVLQSIANAISDSVRNADLVCRWGGEEFVVALPNVDISQSIYFCNKIHQHAANIPWQNTIGINPVTLSIGVASYPQDHSDMQSILKLADSALYAAKSQGRNRTCFAKDVDKTLRTSA